VELDGAVKLFFCLCALIIISSVFSAMGEGTDNSAFFTAVRFCSVGAIISTVIYLQYSHFEMLEDLLIGAINEVMRKVDEDAEQEMGKVSGGFNIPGIF
jgi:hypothetical protein